MNKYYYFITICLLSILSMNLVNAKINLTEQNRDCFQETANVSTSCGGLNTGTYSYYGDGTCSGGSFSNGIDGIQSTSCTMETVIADAIFYVNYSIPINTYNASWNLNATSDVMGIPFNMVCQIEETCLNYDNLTLQLRLNRIYNLTGNTYIIRQCYNKNWINLTDCNYDNDYLISKTDNLNFYEDNINWIIYYLTENSQTYNPISYETSSENFIINISYDNNYYQIATATLNYNGTDYQSSQIGSGSTITFNKTLDIPLANTDGEKKLFYWTIGLTNSTGTYYYNSTFYNQTIYQINFTNDSSSGIKALNFTAYDQKTLNQISSFNFKGTFNYYLGTGIYSRNFSIINNAITSQAFYIRNHTNYKITGTIQYSADNYATTDYNLLNTIINNQTQNISLYLLNLTFSTSYIIKVQDNNQNPLADYLVYIYRYDAGILNPYLVQVIKTDSAGKGIGFFETETVDYKFVITDSNGNIVYTSNKRKIIPETTPYTLIFTVRYITPNPLEYYSNLTGISWSIDYNKNNYLVTYIYTDSNSSFISSSLIIKYLNSSGIDNLVCNNTLFNPSGVLTCNMSGNLSGTYSAVTYVNRGGTSYQVDNLIFNIDTTAQVYGMIGLLIGFIIILICAFTFAFNEIAGIIFVNIGIIFTQIIGLINFGWIFIFAIISISIIIAIILERS